ncbi:hypothetical protein BvCmsSIP076_04407 [Escherichia coli]|nr:hypothetical protein BvCmsSIP076_04407 [Escherichia coli]
MGGDDIFQLHAGDILATAFDHIAAAIDEIKKAFFVAVSGIAGMQPAISFQHFCSGFRVEKILFEDGFPWYAFNTDFTDLTCRERAIVIVADLRFVAKPRSTNRRPASFIARAIADNAHNGFRHPIRRQQANAEAFTKRIFFLLRQVEIKHHFPQAVLPIVR